MNEKRGEETKKKKENFNKKKTYENMVEVGNV